LPFISAIILEYLLFNQISKVCHDASVKYTNFSHSEFKFICLGNGLICISKSSSLVISPLDVERFKKSFMPVHVDKN